jgi:uncharacterized protein YegP (UPF0339 family)
VSGVLFVNRDDTVEPARIMAEVYRAEDGLRWRIRSAARGRRVISDSGQGYSRRSDAFRGLLLVTGGRYVRISRNRYPDGSAYEQGSILRRTPEGRIEDIFVEYVGKPGDR